MDHAGHELVRSRGSNVGSKACVLIEGKNGGNRNVQLGSMRQVSIYTLLITVTSVAIYNGTNCSPVNNVRVVRPSGHFDTRGRVCWPEEGERERTVIMPDEPFDPSE